MIETSSSSGLTAAEKDELLQLEDAEDTTQAAAEEAERLPVEDVTAQLQDETAQAAAEEADQLRAFVEQELVAKAKAEIEEEMFRRC